jgi:hypothetical protein
MRNIVELNRLVVLRGLCDGLGGLVLWMGFMWWLYSNWDMMNPLQKEVRIEDLMFDI